MSPPTDILKHMATWDLHNITLIVRNSQLALLLMGLPMGSASDIDNQLTQAYCPHLTKIPGPAYQASLNQGLPHHYNRHKPKGLGVPLKGPAKRKHEKIIVLINTTSPAANDNWLPHKNTKPYALDPTVSILYPEKSQTQKQTQWKLNEQ